MQVFDAAAVVFWGDITHGTFARDGMKSLQAGVKGHF